MLHKAVCDFQPTYLTVCFDTPAPTFRNKLYDQYQIQRPKISDEFATQIPSVKEALDQAQINHLEKDGFEADDLIGTIAKTTDKKTKVLILTGDKDILQLVDDHIFVITPQLGLSNITLMDVDAVVKKMGIKPDQIPDLKALMGDQSDNYSGAKGIGPKIAAKLINQFGCIKILFKQINKIDDARIKKILLKNQKNILLSYKLATIDTKVKIKYDINQSLFAGFNDSLKEYLLKFEMKGLVKRIYGIKKTNNISLKKLQPQMSLF